MSGVVKYFKNQTKWRMFWLEHEEPADFYLSVWQTNKSAAPLLIWRAILFLTSLGIVITSMIFSILGDKFRFWFIYLTHWGITVNLIATGFATFVSARCFFYGPINTKYRLPWYVKSYWIFCNIATPLAFLITVFYWTVLFEAGIEEELNHGLDVAVHGVNSLVMFLLLISSAQPIRTMHIFHPLIFTIVYLFFTIIYYLAGGIDMFGNKFIYPVIRWENPGSTLGVVALTALLLVILFLITTGITLARDAIAVRLVQPAVKVYITEEVPLRRPTESNA